MWGRSWFSSSLSSDRNWCDTEIKIGSMTARRIRDGLGALHGLGMHFNQAPLRGMPVSMGMTRAYAASPSSPTTGTVVEFSKARNAFRKSLSESRKAWSREAEEKRAASAREQSHAQKEREKRRQLHLEKIGSGQRQDREASVANIERQREEQRAFKAARREENVNREAGRQAVLATLREGKKRQMLEHSKHWIGNDVELDAAIDRAVEASEPLFVSSKVVRGPRQ